MYLFVLLNSFVNWYSKLNGNVKWTNILSAKFAMHSGVREENEIT